MAKSIWRAESGLCWTEELGENEKGLEWGQRALTIDPEDTRMLYNLTCLYCAANRLEDPVGYFERAIEAGNDPRFPAA